MAVKLVYHQIEVCPTAGDHDDVGHIIPGVEIGQCQVVNAEFIGGGGEKRFLVHVVAFESVSEPEERSPETGARDAAAKAS